jgi:hypothetical protein
LGDRAVFDGVDEEYVDTSARNEGADLSVSQRCV